MRVALPALDGWLFLEPDAVPERWRDRAVHIAFVPLLPDEMAAFTHDSRVTVELLPDEVDIARLAASGLTANQVSIRLDVPLRTVQRRMARMRDRFGLRSALELGTFLAGRGWSAGASTPVGGEGRGAPSDEVSALGAATLTKEARHEG